MERSVDLARGRHFPRHDLERPASGLELALGELGCNLISQKLGGPQPQSRPAGELQSARDRPPAAVEGRNDVQASGDREQRHEPHHRRSILALGQDTNLLRQGGEARGVGVRAHVHPPDMLREDVEVRIRTRRGKRLQSLSQAKVSG